MKTYKKLQNCSELLVKKMHRVDLTRMNECSGPQQRPKSAQNSEARCQKRIWYL